jgi:hypothetical protein
LFIILFGVFSISMSAIHALPYRDDDVRAVLLPEDGCAESERQACWLGVRLGETTAAEAVDLLSQHPWVADVLVDQMLRRSMEASGAIRWHWNGQQPERLSGFGELYAAGGVIRTITLQTNIAVGDLWLHLGQPQQGVFSFLRGSMLHHSFYADTGLQALSQIDCPTQINDFWKAIVRLEVRPSAMFNGEYQHLSWLPYRSC